MKDADVAARALGAAAALLLTACVKLADLLMSRWAARRGEVAVRAALGAGRGRLESLCFAAADVNRHQFSRKNYLLQSRLTSAAAALTGC